MLEDQLFVQWHSKAIRLDRDSKLYDRSAESAMRPLLKDFINWLSSAEYDEEEAYGEEEAGAGEEEETKDEETEAQRNQRELVEAQKRAQTEMLAAAKASGEE